MFLAIGLAICLELRIDAQADRSEPSAAGSGNASGGDRPLIARTRRSAHSSIWRIQRRRQRWECLSPRKLRLGDFGPCFAEDLQTSQASFIEYSHIGRMAVVKLLQDIMHRYTPVIHIGGCRRLSVLSNHFDDKRKLNRQGSHPLMKDDERDLRAQGHFTTLVLSQERFPL
jgi:hypothetical protein